MLKHLASFFVLAFICTSIVSAQDYLITFSGSGESTTVETVEVKNIDQQTTLSLNGTDTLLLTDVVGTGHLPPLNQGMIIYPNPADHASRLEFYNSSAGNTLIELYDFSGRLLILKSIQLSAGNHSFTISGLNAGIYIIKVNTPEHIDSRRLVSTSVKHLAPKLQYEGLAEIRQDEPALKSPGNIVAMQYNEGERIVFKAISGVYAHTKSLVPTESQNIDFEFMDCIDGDGNQYGVVTIGDQVWMTENLKYLPLVSGPDYGSEIDAHYYVYGYNGWDVSAAKATADYQNYGVLYNWPASLNACPPGWHLPSDAEWSQLVDDVVSQGFVNNNIVTNSAGNALKSCRQENSPLGGDCSTAVHPRWNSHSVHHGFDEFGFSALPGGFRSSYSSFSSLGMLSEWWSATEHSSTTAWSRGIRHLFGGVYNVGNNRSLGYSVRCIRDN